MKYSGIYKIMANNEKDADRSIIALFNEAIRPDLEEFRGPCEFVATQILPIKSPFRDFPGEYEVHFLLILPQCSLKKGDPDFWVLEYDMGADLYSIEDPFFMRKGA